MRTKACCGNNPYSRLLNLSEYLFTSAIIASYLVSLNSFFFAILIEKLGSSKDGYKKLLSSDNSPNSSLFCFSIFNISLFIEHFLLSLFLHVSFFISSRLITSDNFFIGVSSSLKDDDLVDDDLVDDDLVDDDLVDDVFDNSISSNENSSSDDNLFDDDLFDDDLLEDDLLDDDLLEDDLLDNDLLNDDFDNSISSNENSPSPDNDLFDDDFDDSILSNENSSSPDDLFDNDLLDDDLFDNDLLDDDLMSSKENLSFSDEDLLFFLIKKFLGEDIS